MPKKTKKEKIIAEYRRKLGAMPALSTPSFVYQAKTPATLQTAVTAQPMDRAIRKDLMKTLMLAAVAIAGEVVLARIVK